MGILLFLLKKVFGNLAIRQYICQFLSQGCSRFDALEKSMIKINLIRKRYHYLWRYSWKQLLQGCYQDRLLRQLEVAKVLDHPRTHEASDNLVTLCENAFLELILREFHQFHENAILDLILREFHQVVHWMILVQSPGWHNKMSWLYSQRGEEAGWLEGALSQAQPRSCKFYQI